MAWRLNDEHNTNDTLWLLRVTIYTFTLFHLSILFKLRAKKHRSFTLAGFRQFLFAVTMLPAKLKSRSEEQLVAGTHRYLRASLARWGNVMLLAFHHCNGSPPLTRGRLMYREISWSVTALVSVSSVLSVLSSSSPSKSSSVPDVCADCPGVDAGAEAENQINCNAWC